MTLHMYIYGSRDYDTVFHITIEDGNYNLEIYEHGKLLKKDGLIKEETALTILSENRQMSGDELDTFKAKVLLVN